MKRYIFFISVVLVFYSCDRDNNNPGYSYFPDMQESVAYETYSTNPVFEDGVAMRLPVAGTVPRGHIPYQYEKTEEDMVLAGLELKNPYTPTPAVLDSGKLLFERFCITCHGDLGDGKGYLFTSGRYPFPPASLIAEKAQVKPDGEFFHNITVGFGVMGAHGSQVLPDERWKIVTYIRNVLHVNANAAADTSMVE
jgi:mono/diheme cytochrome c family protein